MQGDDVVLLASMRQAAVRSYMHVTAAFGLNVSLS